jgi:hypothetical protein
MLSLLARVGFDGLRFQFLCLLARLIDSFDSNMDVELDAVFFWRARLIRSTQSWT